MELCGQRHEIMPSLLSHANAFRGLSSPKLLIILRPINSSDSKHVQKHSESPSSAGVNLTAHDSDLRSSVREGQSPECHLVLGRISVHRAFNA